MRQPNVNNQQDLMDAAALAKVELDKVTKTIADNFKGKAILVPCKTWDKVYEKMHLRDVQKEADEVFDVARSTVLFIDPNKFEMAITSLKNRMPANVDNADPFNNKLECWRMKDRYKAGGGAQPGYSDVQCILKLPLNDGKFKAHLAELQLNLNSIAEAKHMGHAFYEITRVNCQGQLNSLKYDKMMSKLRNLKVYLDQLNFWHPAGVWAQSAEAKRKFNSIIQKLEKMPQNNFIINVNAEECCFCKILQDLMYPVVYRKKMSQIRVKKWIVVHGEKKEAMLPALSEDEVQAAEDKIMELAAEWSLLDKPDEYPAVCKQQIDKWVANKKFREWLKAKKVK